MENKKLNIEDFSLSTLSKKEQKTVRGGGEEEQSCIPGDTIRGNGKGST
ncbi:MULTISPECIES: rSAM-modified peptide [unclassified Flavobacterium]|nr:MULTISPECIES: rSAM-modified peptide [unclassified Flavobacterium]